MEKQKRWHLVLILSVIALTIYNILPSIFFYTKPLKKPVNETQAHEISVSALKRVNQLEVDAKEWLRSFAKLLGVKASSIELDAQNPDLIHVTLTTHEEAARFRTHLPKAGALIPFVPSQLALAESQNEAHSKTVTIQRKIPIHFNPEQAESYFFFADKYDSQGEPTPAYREIIDDRLLELGLVIGGVSESARYVSAVLDNPNDPRTKDFLLAISENILTISKVFGENTPNARRFYSSFTQGNFSSPHATIDQLINALDRYKDQVRLTRISLQDEEKRLSAEGSFLDALQKEHLDILQSQERRLTTASSILKREKNSFAGSERPLTYATLMRDVKEGVNTLQIGQRNPLIQEIVLDVTQNTISLKLHREIQALREELAKSPTKRAQSQQLDQLIYDEIARISRLSDETITPYQENFRIALTHLNDSRSFLALKLPEIAKKEADQLTHLLQTTWNPKHPDLKADQFPILSWEDYQALPRAEQGLGLVVYTPSTQNERPPSGFRNNSIYVVAKGVEQILAKVQKDPSAPSSKAFMDDFKALRDLLQRNGYIAYPGSTFPLSAEFSKDYIFESEDFYQYILSATRENFTVSGTKRYALLEFTNLEQRILTLNRIESAIHEDLLKWRDEYNAAQINPHLEAKYDVPKPTQSPLLSNFVLSFKKYFRGDERKILNWGLDLSGGKSVQIELRDANGRPVTDEADINQGINELYRRVNKMGVSEVTIRREGSHISLDFPGAQGLNAADLIKASSMQFHIVNEKFSAPSSPLYAATNRFLEEIWNEAVVTGKKDPESLAAIAYSHLYGEGSEGSVSGPRSEAAKTLYENGLRFSPPGDLNTSSVFNDSLSKITLLRGDSFAEWGGQTHPLLIVFKNFALEGSSLDDIHAGYDPAKGNFLSFQVKSSLTTPDGQKLSPRSDLYNWTSIFSKDKIMGSQLATYSGGEGWRMAVILNGTVISSPRLDDALRTNAMITGSFTQREINRLESDLKAGSLTYTPTILSEQNVSPELGHKERIQGIVASAVALLLVIVIMVAYYRFGGVIASIAVIFNLLIMWATMQNIQATITLANIAGMILVIGMAVDANVLVFERIREELESGKRLALAIGAGYKRAFSAIADSNITTIIAALILLNFDSGPIKGFAVSLIIGIVSSMFSALFMTRYFFTRWVKNPKRKELKMANWVKTTNFNFIKASKFCITLSVAIALVGTYLLIAQRKTIYGMDFTGGYSVTLKLETRPDNNYKELAQKALIAAGAAAQDFEVRELSPQNNLRLSFGVNMDSPGRPFFEMPFEKNNPNIAYPYQDNPRLVWIVDALAKEGLVIPKSQLETLQQNWVSISGQMSDSMRNSALWGLGIALFAILGYITLRFEFKYALSATICLAHDVIITIGAISILNKIGLALPIDLKTIAALMTIVGYSLNDTIIIFDRIREDLKTDRKSTFRDLINKALNTTLSRTVMTSLTTLIVLLTLVFLGGSSIFGFALVMTLGVLFGTLSSLFIAAPILLFLHNKEEAKEKRLALSEK